jgi:hypothetical protein
MIHRVAAAALALAALVRSIRDYRGFDEREGWRHAVAHTSDAMLQLPCTLARPKRNSTRCSPRSPPR